MAKPAILALVHVDRTILTIRGDRVMLDRDLAEVYGVTTKALNQAVKRNEERFPADFSFQLTREERDEVVTNCDHFRKLKYAGALLSAANLKELCIARRTTEVPVSPSSGILTVPSTTSNFTSEEAGVLRSQIVTSKKGQGGPALRCGKGELMVKAAMLAPREPQGQPAVDRGKQGGTQPRERTINRLTATMRGKQDEVGKLDAPIAGNLKELGYGG